MFKKSISTFLAIFLLIGAGGAAHLSARTKLTSLPGRDRIRIDLRSPGHNLVEEERNINLQRGKNQIEFAWAGVQIDKNSLRIRPLKTPGKVNVLNVNFPPGERALFWEVYSDTAGPAVFRISYLMGGLARSFSYEAIADPEEKFLRLKTHFTFRNNSGERFEKAKLQLNFGKEFRRDFAIGESKKILAASFPKIPIVKAYHFDPATGSKEVGMFYELKNSPERGLGQFPMPGGKARIYQQDRHGSEAFIGEDWAKYTPFGQTMSLYLGQAREIKVRHSVYNAKTEPVKLPVTNYRRVIRFQIENFKDNTVPLTLHEHPGGEWDLLKIVLKVETGERNNKNEKVIAHGDLIKTERKDINNLRLKFNLPPTRNKKYNLYLHLLLKNRW